MGESMEAINKKRHWDQPYIAGLNGEKIILYAISLAEAKQRAIEHFKPKKKDRGLLWVELATEE